MATSGRIEGGRTFGQAYFYINWWLNGQNVANNTSNIGWNAGYHFQNNDCQLDDGVVNLNGERWRNAGRVKNYQGVFTPRDHQIASGSFDIGHNADGTAWLSVSGGVKPYQNNRSESSGGWDLPTIPRQVHISNVTGNFTSDNLTPTVSWANNGNRVDLKIELPDLGVNPWKQWTSLQGVSSYSPSLSATDIADLLAKIPNATSIKLRFTLTTVINGNAQFYSYIDKVMTVVNANPTFSDFGYRDSNTAIVAISGNDQAIIQGKSSLQAIISSAQKMTAIKGATAQKYALSFGQTNANQNYSTSDVAVALGVPTQSGTQRLTVTAFDSRNNSKSVYKDIPVIPYSPPTINASIARLNSFEEQTTLKIAGSFASVLVDGEAKNGVVANTGVKYRVKEATASEWGEWTTVVVAVADNRIVAPDIIMALDNTKQFDVQISLTDRFETRTVNLILNVGEPVLYIGKNGVIGVNTKPASNKKGLHLKNDDNLFLQIHPVGSLFFTTANINPKEYFGGEWEAYATGRTLVGVGSNGTTNYANPNATGGVDGVAISTAQMPSHDHNMVGIYDDANYNHGTIPSGGKQYSLPFDAGGITRTFQTENAGGGLAHENRMPFITCYIWRRIS